MRNLCIIAVAATLSSVAWAGTKTTDSIVDIRKTLETYAEGAKLADITMMSKAFSDDATIHGYMDPQMQVTFNGPISVLYNEVKAGGPMPNLQHVITDIEVRETIATARVDETGWVVKKPNAPAVEMAFTDMYTLMKTPDKNDASKFHWAIISKVFYTVPQN